MLDDSPGPPGPLALTGPVTAAWTPLFFLSYAHAGEHARIGSAADPDRAVIEFFDDLSAHVDQLMGRRAGEDSGFIDRSLQAGAWWSPELLYALNTCQVFVALLAPAYLKSEWCQREWETFAARRVVRQDGHTPVQESCILPVTWLPTRGALPQLFEEVQRFSPTRLPDPGTAANLSREGLYGLHLGWRDDYQLVTWRLAQRISDLCSTHRVEPAVSAQP